MAWPLTPLTTYVTSSTPAVKATDLNKFQSTTNESMLGTVSFKGFSVDGIGGQATAAPAGTITVTAASTTSINPTFLTKDTSGNYRWTLDHNGFPTSKLFEFHESWIGDVNTSGATGVYLSTMPIWIGKTTANAAIVNGANTDDTPSVLVTPGTANTNSASLRTRRILTLETDSVLVFEAEVNATIGGNCTFFAGLTGAYTETLTTTVAPTDVDNAIMFQKRSADTYWQAAVCNATTLTFTATSATPGTHDFLRIEYHGSLSPLGVAAVEECSANTAKARFFFNGVRHVTTSTTLPAVNKKMSIIIGAYATGATTDTVDFHKLNVVKSNGYPVTYLI